MVVDETFRKVSHLCFIPSVTLLVRIVSRLLQQISRYDKVSAVLVKGIWMGTGQLIFFSNMKNSCLRGCRTFASILLIICNLYAKMCCVWPDLQNPGVAFSQSNHPFVKITWTCCLRYTNETDIFYEYHRFFSNSDRFIRILDLVQ